MHLTRPKPCFRFKVSGLILKAATLVLARRPLYLPHVGSKLLNLYDKYSWLRLHELRIMVEVRSMVAESLYMF